MLIWRIGIGVFVERTDCVINNEIELERSREEKRRKQEQESSSKDIK